MTLLSISMMVVICGVVWGGFAALLLRAIQHEGRKGAGQTRE